MQTGTRNDSGTFTALPDKTGFTQLIVPLTLRLGLIDNLEGMVGLPISMNTATPAAGSAQSSTGIGNLGLALKYQLMHEAGVPAPILSDGSSDPAYDGSMDLSLALSVNTPTGKTAFDKPDAARLGTDITAWDKMDVGATLLTAKTWGAFKLTTNLGYYYTPEVDGTVPVLNTTVKVNYSDYFAYGLTGEYAMMDNGGLILELMGRNDLDTLKLAGVAAPNSQSYGLYLNPGIQLRPMDNLDLSLTCAVPVAGRNSQDFIRPTLTASYIF
ncbi:MAG TPA: hypothetical protein DD435_07050 [Cyanobacteria bacterium UBA8530]|nr:hypothetical protein [Cyanobacteria bacterium UBA8530]